ncbi:nucleobase-ascorbate transporter 3-like [Chenopodium quinoa]|uniref:nucleobase-ascorbate transporter 3-like n=1 Tax=Chenopodium quinoa TaxID=63459 RepID=UPI000B7800B9|nr:nucleobase-ascorbate transporter 3-like [Chenopodium quinoa]
MGETGNHNHDHHNHSQNNHPPPPSQSMAPPPLQSGSHLPMGAARGPIFQPQEQLTNLHYCIHSNPSWHQTCILGFQHYIVMLGTTILITNSTVPAMGGNRGDRARVIQSLLFMSGINTLIQTLIGSRLPVVMGPSYVYLIPVMTIVISNNSGNFASEHQRFIHNIRTVQGSLIVSSFVSIILGFSKAWGNFTRLFSPVVIVPVVSVVGLGLFARGFPQLANCVELGLPMLILLVLVQQYAKRIHSRAHSILERYALLICMGIIWAFAAILTAGGVYNRVKDQTKMSCRTDRNFLVSSAPWIKIPYPFQWGTPIFSAGSVFGMMGAALVASAETTGTFYAAARLSGATPPPAHVLSRSIGWQGISMLLDGLFGTVVGTTASVENVGLLGLTHVGSRRVVQVSTAFMIFFSIFGKFGAFFASIPLPIFAAIYCILYGIVAANGISFIQFTNNNSMRNMYVLGLSLFLGISIPYYFMSYTMSANHGPVNTGGSWFNDILNAIFSSPATVAMIVGTLLDITLEPRDTALDRGVPWWIPFQNRKGEVRNEEFYSLPLRINEFMPTRFIK